MNDELDAGAEIIEGAAGAPEGAPAASPTTDDVKQMYDELGIKAVAPTGATKGRPKASDVRDKKLSSEDGDDTKSGRDDKSGSAVKSKDASDSTKDGDAGNDTDTKGTKERKDSGKIYDESDEAEDGVRDAKSRTEEDSERGRKEDSDEGDDRAGQESDESNDEAQEDEDVEGKRPGKSNPAIEKRIQRLTEERRAAEERASALEQQLQEKEQAVQQAKIAQEDPEYTIDDFRKVTNEQGEIIELDEERAELAWRRWKDGYDARAEQRNAEANRQAELDRAQAEYSENIMRQSVEAYDSLAGLMDEYPELVSNSGKFDSEFAAVAMPIIHDAIIYQPGTEPGSKDEDGNPVKAVIMGLKINPKQILDGMKKIQAAKRALPLNGLNDNVEVRSNVNVQHSRSSDPTVNAANELYKELNINKRI
jgi:hypothetical protein